MRSTQAIRTELLSAVAPGLQMKTFPSTHGRVKLSISETPCLRCYPGRDTEGGLPIREQ